MLKEYFEFKRPEAIHRMNKRLTLKRVLKIVFPIVALGLIVLVFIDMNKKKRIPHSSIAMLNEAKGLQYQGKTNKGMLFNIESSKATELTKGKIEFDGIRSVLQNKKGEKIYLSSREGNFNKSKQSIVLSGDVHLKHDNGLVLKTKSAEFNVETGVTQGNEPIVGIHAQGVLHADRFRVEDSGSQIILSGNSKLILNGK